MDVCQASKKVYITQLELAAVLYLEGILNTMMPQVEAQRELVQKLRVSVFRRCDPSANDALLAELAQAEKQLKELESTAAMAQAQTKNGFLGEHTTGLRVSTDLHMQPIPTGIYHLLNPTKTPLVSVNIKNSSPNPKRLRTTVYIEGLSAQAVRTCEVAAKKDVTISLFPTLLPERVRQLSEVQWVTLHVIVDILPSTTASASSDKQSLAEICESHDTYVVLCLSRNSGLNSMFDSETKQWIDLYKYYGAWVTPYEPSVQRCLRQAADSEQKVVLQGYLGNRESVTSQVNVIFNALKAQNLMYINSVLDYGMSTKHSTQRTRLPRESLAQQSANCLDGTVLMASLLEGASLNPVLAFIPGHAFLGWEPVEGSSDYEYVETTMIGTHDFKDACNWAKKLATQYAPLDLLQTFPVHRLRQEGIYPME